MNSPKHLAPAPSAGSEHPGTAEHQPSPNAAAIDGLLDFSFVEISMDEDQVVETGGSCCSCS